MASEIPDHLYRAFRKVCLALPETEEIETWGHPTFRVRNKIFASLGVNELDFTQCTMKCEDQDELLDRGYPFFYPSYVGPKGWIGVTIEDETDWSEVAGLVRDSYRATAPKKLWKLVDV